MALPDLNRQLIRRQTLPVEPGLKICTYDYATKEASATVLTAGHFNFGRAYLRPGDRIDAVTEADDAAESETLSLKVVTVPATGNVTVAAASGIDALTDSSGGTASDTIAAIGSVYDQTEIANAIASLTAKINALL